MKHALLFVVLFLTTFVATQAQNESGVHEINGTRLFVSQAGQGEPIIVLHGGPGLNQAYFKPHLSELEKNFRVIYYDQRASGKSTAPSPDSITMELLVNDLESLRKELNLNTINILAHSWGAVLAVHYSLAYPSNIRKLVLSNPSMLSREFDGEAAKIAKARTTAEDSVRRAALMANSMREVRDYEDFFLLSFKASAFDIKNLTHINLDLPADFPEASKMLFSGLMKDPATQKDLYPELVKVKFPVLIIHGQADVIPPASIDKLRTGISHAAYELFSQSGHFPFVEETEKFNTTVKSFLFGKEKKKKASR